MLDHIAINDFLPTPKYVQIYNSIVSGIENHDIVPGEKLPSIYELCAHFDVAKGTVEKAYDLLKENEIIQSVQGKGYYINHTRLGRNLKILLLFNKLSAHKKMIYDAFVERLGTDASIDFYIYNNDYKQFADLLERHNQGYTHYVVIAHFYDRDEQAVRLIDRLPKHKLVVLDKLVEGVTGNYSAVYQNFEKDLMSALGEALPLLRKYTTLNILFPVNTYLPRAILSGFYRFCYEHRFEGRVLPDMEKEEVKAGYAYINLMEEDLYSVIKKIKETDFQVGEEVGILSYNETLLKELLLDGITVMSTDFAGMGYTAAELVLGNTPQHIENPFRLIVRKSL
ncbi:MAG: GntR family transcriptional regulator [Cytophagales bacterium]|nr:MAG: GntR family transcriptional regulator [Cytophagales bacterium]